MPWPPNNSHEHVSLLCLPREMQICGSFPRLHRFWNLRQTPHVLLTLGRVHNPLRLPCEATSERPKDRQFLTLLTWKRASRQNGVQVFISHLARWLDPREPQIIGKTQWMATFLPFRAPAPSFLWLFLFSDLLSSSLLFSSLTLPTSAFPSVHIVGSLTSRLPWTIGESSAVQMCEKAEAESCKLVFGLEGGGGDYLGHKLDHFDCKWDRSGDQLSFFGGKWDRFGPKLDKPGQKRTNVP